MVNDFKQSVYSAVKKIPRCKVATYKQIAAIIRRPKAYRAVANALAKNKNLIIIPCHRVIKSSLEIGNYRLGQRAKEKILRKEGIKIKKGKLEDTNQLYNF